MSKLSVLSYLGQKKRRSDGVMDITYPVIRTDRFGGEDMFEVADKILFLM